MTYANGDRYVGEWNNDERCGKGTLTCINGDECTGTWREERERHVGHEIPDGEGTITFANGDQYVGEWVGSVQGRCSRSGIGTMIYAKSEEKTGKWYQDRFIGGAVVI